jgi:hypothetical protein
VKKEKSEKCFSLFSFLFSLKFKAPYFY